MTYLNGSPNIVRSHAYMRSSAAQRGTWFSLWAYCHEMDSNGQIHNCQDWPDNLWIAISVDATLVREESQLWHWAGNNLHVAFFNKDAQKTHLTKVAKGREYAMRRWENANEPKKSKPVGEGLPNGSPIGSPNGSPDTYVGKEGSMYTSPNPPQPTINPPVNGHSTTARKVKRVPLTRPIGGTFNE